MGRYGRLGLLRFPRRADKEAARHYLELVGMADFADRQIGQLSGGQQQRLFLARALLQGADLYLLDEPFVGIDLATQQWLVQFLHQLRAEGKTVCIVHHDLAQVESLFSWLLLLNMRLVASGPTSEVFTPDLIEQTYGSATHLLEEVVGLARRKRSGWGQP
jgi:manganese/zinc/iron transport system ATP- binding protein